MCGIFCTPGDQQQEFEILYEKNSERGSQFSLSQYIKIYDKRYDIVKSNKLSDISSSMISYLNGNFKREVLLGHLRAPTSSECRDYNPHPFIYGEWTVAHNGIINNYKDFKLDVKVDSNVIPKLLDKTCRDKDTIETLVSVFESLDGIFGCWVLNTKLRTIYLVRNASSIFVNENYISSAKVKGYEMLPNKTIWEYYTAEHGFNLKKIADIKVKNDPYYIHNEK
jgi:glucosamine 6-phosphate synthetase-like amidotransferase/phosphosugar isomerase protein